MATTDVLLRIGSSIGPGGFASLESAINMTRQLISVGAQQISQLDDYVEKMGLVNMELINYADKMSAAQVGSIKLMESMGALNTVGIKVNKEQFAAMAVAANDYSDRVGGTAMEAMDRLTNAVIKGNERGLKPFGIVLDENNKKMDGTEQALDQISKKFGSTQVQVGNFSEAVLAVKNEWNDMMGSIWSGISTGYNPMSKFLTMAAEGFGSVGEKLSSLNVTQKEYFNGLGLSVDGLKLLHYQIQEFTRGLTDAEKTQREIIASNTLAMLTGGKFGQYEIDLKVGGKSLREAKDLAEKVAQQVIPTPKPKKGGSKTTEQETAQQRADRIWNTYKGWSSEAMGGARKDVQPDLFGGPSSMTISDIEAFGAGGGQRYATDAQIAQQENNNARIDSQLQINEAKLTENDLLRDKMELLYQLGEVETDSQELYQESLEKEAEAGLQAIKTREAQIEAEEAYANSMEGKSKRIAKYVDNMTDSWTSLRSSIGVVMQAYEQGTKGMTKAAATMYYIDCIMNVIIEGARAAASFAKGPAGIAEGVLHVAAAAAFTAAAAVAASHGGSSGAGGASTVSAVGPAATAGQYSGGYNRAENQTVTVNITMDDSAKGLGWIARENDRAARSGEPHFVKAA